MSTFLAEIEPGTNVQSQPENIRSCIFIPIPVWLCLAVSMAAQAVRSGPMCLRSADEFEEPICAQRWSHLPKREEKMAKKRSAAGLFNVPSRWFGLEILSVSVSAITRRQNRYVNPEASKSRIRPWVICCP